MPDPTAWTPPRDWTTGETVTAAHLNVQTRDNSEFLHGPPSCRVFNSASQSRNSNTNLSFDSVRYDTHGMHPLTGDLTRITIVEPGIYLIVANCDFPTGTAGFRRLSLTLNDSTFIARSNAANVDAGSGTSLNVTTIWRAAENDFFTARVEFTPASMSIPSTVAFSPEFMVAWIGT